MYVNTLRRVRPVARKVMGGSADSPNASIDLRSTRKEPFVRDSSSAITSFSFVLLNLTGRVFPRAVSAVILPRGAAGRAATVTGLTPSSAATSFCTSLVWLTTSAPVLPSQRVHALPGPPTSSHDLGATFRLRVC